MDIVKPYLQGTSIRKIAQQILQVLVVVSSALAMWKAGSVVFWSDSPIVVVLRCVLLTK